MQRLLRPKRRIDYKVLNATGVIVSKSKLHDKENVESPIINELSNLFSSFSLNEENSDSNINIQMDQLNSNQQTIFEDISDLIDENPVDDLDSIEDIDFYINKIEQYRTQYRSFHKQLEILSGENYETTFQKQYDLILSKIKEYVKLAKQKRKHFTGAKHREDQYERDSKRRSRDFLMNEIKRSIRDMKSKFNSSLEDENDGEVLLRKTNLSDHLKMMENLSKRFRELLESSSTEIEDDINNISHLYKELVAENEIYIHSLEKQIKIRELNKQDLFKESNLNIKLSKFKGYESQTDIYTFQSEFEKLHERCTPKRMLPDLLKNNYLEDPALSIVKSVDDIKEIWDRLKSAYGDPKSMLTKKLLEVSKFGMLWKIKEPERLMEGLSKIINLMKDLMKLAHKHDVENRLYYGDGLERIYRLMGETRVTRWFSKITDDNVEGEQLWMRLIQYLERELKVQQQRCLIQVTFDNTVKIPEKEGKFGDKSHNRYKSHYETNLLQSTCFICGETDHVATNGPNNSKLIQYFSCKKFVDMNPNERFLMLKRKGLCIQCLYPGADQDVNKHKDGKCQRDFTCKNTAHDKFPVRKHVLICHEHRDTQENKDLLQEYKSRCIIKRLELPEFSKEIKLSFHVNLSKQVNKVSRKHKDDSIINDSAIYILQTVRIGCNQYTLFYDTGCGDLVCRYQAVRSIGDRAIQEFEGPITLGGVGDIKTQSPHGVYKVRLPLHNGEDATMSGVCIDQITATFPNYPLQGRVESDIKEAFKINKSKSQRLPKLPKFVGGETDFMIGAKYLRYYPEEVFQLPSGLTIYRSKFTNADGSRGVIGGPHQVFTEVERFFNGSVQHQRTFLSNQYEIFKLGYQANPDVSLLGVKEAKDYLNDIMLEIPEEKESNDFQKQVLSIRNQNIFNQVENAASEILYRCINCRDCKDCKNNDHIESMSIKEEIEQEIINKSVTVDLKNRITTANLPLLHEPKTKLANNRKQALGVYNQQIKKLKKTPQDKDDVLKSESKLQDLGHVDFIRNLSQQQQTMLRDSQVQYHIPWRAVWNGNSISTPCRIVFDASQATDSGFSLNDILAKGRNNMNKLVEIVIRWMTHKVAFHTDVQKMYNSVKLKEEDWCFQRYIWEKDLDPAKIPEEKVIKTLIYGVKSSGNQSERGLRETARLSSKEYPEVNEIVQRDIYVDDCLSGEDSENLSLKRADELKIVLDRGGFSLKGITFSGKPPPESLSSDGKSINVAGMKWFSEDDLISLDISELNFAKKCRGKKPTVNSKNEIPSKLTRRHCVAKVAEIFDLIGRITPITAGMKLDLHTLVQRKLDWDDTIPDDLRQIWESHFQMMTEISDIKFNRAVVPDDAVSLDINTIDTGDSSKFIACIATYVRFKRKCGNYSCQLVFSRSRLIPDAMTQPRAELYAAVVNAHTGEVVKRSFHKHHKSSIKLTDSQIVLHWINNYDKPLKQWVRNRVIEIRRFTNPEDWKYVHTKDMIADIGTRRGVTLKQVSQGSLWQNGFEWMKLDASEFPTKSVEDIKLDNEEVQAVKKESLLKYEPNNNPLDFNWSTESNQNLKLMYPANTKVKRSIPSEVLKRYEFSDYIIDPNKHRFKTVVRIVAIVQRFIYRLIAKIRNKISNTPIKDLTNNEPLTSTVTFTDDDILNSEKYFYRKATCEVKKFVKESQYAKITTEKDEILYYTGRILPTQNINSIGNMTEVMQDLSSTSFCVPVIDKHSPLAYSIINEVHWHNKKAKHSGIETVLRYTLQKAYIIEGRDLVKRFRKSCERCRYLAKKCIDVAMGPVSKHNLTIAPPFFITQVDLAGPFKSYSPQHKRTTVKIWIVVFCCATTSTTIIKVMDDYSSSSFIQSFIRFSCEVGYPKMLLPDEGSQLVKGCETMKLNFQDIKNRLYREVNVEFQVCPVGGHNMHGKVERKIKEVKISLEKSIQNERLSILQWETLVAEIGNTINDLPLALGNVVSDFENMDLITPNRLRLGRNNDRSPVGPMMVTNSPERFINLNQQIFNVWFESWMISHVPKLMYQPKWFNSERDVKVGDVVLFLKQEGSLCGTYQYGIISTINRGTDGNIRKVNVRYRNHNENIDRETSRAVRQLIMIHPIDELNIIQELGEIASFADLQLTLRNQ